ncbi:hypothetical protein [Actinomadura sp. 6N118]|uniref:hypothetical protein n=1 Tax=Actinomadura sp. 6N118 TaxID=3375151 RepID=UPI0037B27A98
MNVSPTATRRLLAASGAAAAAVAVLHTSPPSYAAGPPAPRANTNAAAEARDDWEFKGRFKDDTTCRRHGKAGVEAGWWLDYLCAARGGGSLLLVKEKDFESRKTAAAPSTPRR